MTAAQELQPHVLTVDDLMALPEDGWRYELIDGNLLMSPAPTSRHQVVAACLVGALRAACPDGYGAVETVNLQLSQSRQLIPDVVVATADALLSQSSSLTPEDILIAVEIVSPSSTSVDRLLKPAFYAEAGVPIFWRVEEVEGGDPQVITHRLQDGVYAEQATTVAGWLRVEEPFPMAIETATLLSPR